MPDTPIPNNPYARPINATRPEGQMLVGEFYGERAGDKTLAGHNGRQVSPASRFVSKAIAVPAEMEFKVDEPRRKRGRPPGSKNRVKATIDDIVPLDEIDDSYSQGITITEDDLLG